MWHSFRKDHKLMLKNLFKAESASRIDDKYTINKIFCSKRNLDMCREYITIILDVFICLFHCIVFKRRLSEHQSIHNNSYRPYINFIRVTLLLKYFRCDVIRSTTNSLFDISFSFYSSWQSKITYFCIHLIVYKNITKFKISMYNTLAVNIDQTLYYLTYVHSCLKLCESLSSFCKIFQCIVSTVLKQNVNIFFIFKCIHELYDVLVFERFMNFNFDE